MNLYDTLADIVATSSILIKFGFDEVLDDRLLFVEFLNELGFRTETGRKVTSAWLKWLTEEITTKQKARLIEEFNVGFAPIYKQLELYNNRSKY